MGTRADFYVGRGEDAQWLGSIAWDGYPSGIADDFPDLALTAANEKDFSAAVHTRLKERDDGTTPEMGWPWPWNTSATTDYAYAFFDGKVWASGFGRPWFDVVAYLAAAQHDPSCEPPEDGDEAVLPDMSGLKKVTMGERSGLIVMGGGQ